MHPCLADAQSDGLDFDELTHQIRAINFLCGSRPREEKFQRPLGRNEVLIGRLEIVDPLALLRPALAVDDVRHGGEHCASTSEKRVRSEIVTPNIAGLVDNIVHRDLLNHEANDRDRTRDDAGDSAVS